MKTAAQFGAYAFGSDLDGLQMQGKGKRSTALLLTKVRSSYDSGKIPGIYRAADQYGLRSLVMDCATFDVTKNPWRCGDIFDAIVTGR